MTRRSLVAGAGFTGVGSAILQMKPEIILLIPKLESGVGTFLLSFTGVTITAAGLLMLIFAVFQISKSHVVVAAESAREIFVKNWVYAHICASADDLPELFSDFKKVFGNDIAPIDEMKTWWSRNDNIAWRIIRSTTGGKREDVGFFELIPLTGPAVKKIEAGQLDGRTMTVNYIASRGKKTSAYYVGSIAAVKPSKIFRFSTMFVFLEHLRHRSTRSEIVLYARPVTSDGLRLVRDYKFQKLQPRMKDEESVWKAVLPKGSDFTELERIYQRALKGVTFAAT